MTKHLASSFQRHMDLHKHILLCVCRFQTHCLTQKPEAKKLQRAGIGPDEEGGGVERNLNCRGHSYMFQNLLKNTFTSGDFGIQIHLFLSCKTSDTSVKPLIPFSVRQREVGIVDSRCLLVKYLFDETGLRLKHFQNNLFYKMASKLAYLYIK